MVKFHALINIINTIYYYLVEITELFEKYKSELDEDMKINELNLKEAQLMLPGRKHKWAFRLIQQKRDLSKLKLLKKRTWRKGKY